MRLVPLRLWPWSLLGGGADVRAERRCRDDPRSDNMTGVSPRLPGRRIVVVGAGTRRSDDPDAPMGNGRAISVLAAREGASVACVDRDRAAAEETARLLEAEGGTARVVVGDVTDEAACARVIAESADV